MNEIIAALRSKELFTSKIAFGRSILALSSLLTILFNDSSIISNSSLVTASPFAHLSLFSLTSFHTGSVISVLILLFVLSGYLPQISAILQAWVHLSILLSFTIIEGGDQVASNLSILLIPVCIADPRINQWRDYKKQPLYYRRLFLNVYYFLVQVQVAIIYLHSAVGKINRPDWRNGTCMYYWITDNTIGAPLWLQRIYEPLLLSKYVPLFAWTVIFIELGLFACLFSTNTYVRRLFLFLGIMLHAGIAFTHGLMSFSIIMIGALILYLDKNNTVFRVVTKPFRRKRTVPRLASAPVNVGNADLVGTA